jgi:diguanylate cyclase (GGDEF)-like protein
MKRLTAATRIALCMSVLSTSALLLAKAAGLLPDYRTAVMRGRVAFSEVLAVNCSTLASRGDWKQLEAMLRAVVSRNDDLLSVGVRTADGHLKTQIGPHTEAWRPIPAGTATQTGVVVPIHAGKEYWGSVELRYKPTQVSSPFGFSDHPLVELVIFVGMIHTMVFYLFLQRVLKHLDPSKVVPDRVRNALNALVSGLLLLDKDRLIVLANEAFAATLNEPPENLQGMDASTLPWQPASPGEPIREFPWERSLREKTSLAGEPLVLEAPGLARRVFQVNSSPILDEDGTVRGALASFDDVTALESKKEELLTMLDALKKSREAIREQNEKLQILATRDPLTGCLNRRSFFEGFQDQWQEALAHGRPLSCIMVDVDYFKSVNDNYGHSMGDEVLRQVGGLLCDEGKDFSVCRFGGEEFCIALSDVDLEGAAELAERVRRKIELLEFDELSVTASLGASALRLGASGPQELLDQADKCLYAAKRNGRNQVVRWDQIPADLEVDERQLSRTKDSTATDGRTQYDELVAIPYHAVTGLISALAYRDLDTAMHSLRVAELCQATSQNMLSISEQYVLEVAAMLHDIGKVGVPDSILLKPGPLSDEEWRIMNVHARVGVEIVDASFSCPQLTEIVRLHHAHFGGKPDNPSAPQGEDIPVAARILSVADAYDAMVSNRVYRPARPPAEAFAELRRCAPAQFDPVIVERFIQIQSFRLQREPFTGPRVEKDAALQIGLQLEKLAQAVDRQDLPVVASLASHISSTAARYGLEELGRISAELCRLAEGASDLQELIATTQDLLTLAAQARQSYVELSPDVLARTQQGRARYLLGADPFISPSPNGHSAEQTQTDPPGPAARSAVPTQRA